MGDGIKDPFPQLPRRLLFVDDASVVRVSKPRATIGELKDEITRAVEAAAKGGRPSKGKPWEDLGMNERTYRRRKKAGTL